MSNKSNMTNCKHCNWEIAKVAKVCPKCGAKNKKPFYKRPITIIFIFFIFMAFVGAMTDTESTSSNQAEVSNPIENNIGEPSSEETSETETKTPEITYTAYDVSKLVDDLNDNALKAKETYKGQYVELTGKLNVIDSSGKYIVITSINDDFAFTGVQCYLKTDEHKSIITNLSKNDIIIVKGKIKDVGEILGYSLDIDTVSKK